MKFGFVLMKGFILKMRKIALLIPLCFIIAASTMISGCTTTNNDTVTAYVEGLDTIGATGDIQVQFTLVGDDDDEVDLKIQYCSISAYVESGHDALWFNATVIESAAGSSADLTDVSPGSFTFFWDTASDLPTANDDDYILRVMPGVDTEEYSDIEGPIAVTNASSI